MEIHIQKGRYSICDPAKMKEVLGEKLNIDLDGFLVFEPEDKALFDKYQIHDRHTKYYPLGWSG
jgi:hypothetical protein